jgi:NCS1 family nucleobase:cation symporter-1
MEKGVKIVAQEKEGLIETRSIDMIPDHERHGTPFSQFTLWFGANIQITAVVDGALAVVFGADPLWAFFGLLIGNILGGAVMALHSAQGPRLGLPQMISSRAQFGVLGAIIPLILAVVMYLGFATTGTVLSGQAINGILGVQNPVVGIVIFGSLTVLLALLGYKYIHALGRVATITGIIGFTYLMIMAFVKFPVASLFGVKPFALPTFLLAVSLSAGWQLTFGPYVADYSRYLPRNTSQSATFWNTFLGSVIGTQWAMTLGVIITAASFAGYGGNFLKNQVGYLGELAGSGIIAILIYMVIVTSKLTVNTLNAYGSFMSMLTITTALSGKNTASKTLRTLFIVGIITASVCIAIFASKDLLNLFKNFVLVLLMVFTPWSSVNLIDFYWISKENIDIPALYDSNGRYGKWNAPALVSYVVGVLAQIPFLATAMYTGPITKMLGDTDISWIVGLVVTAGIYYPWAKRRNVAPQDMIYPKGTVGM